MLCLIQLGSSGFRRVLLGFVGKPFNLYTVRIRWLCRGRFSRLLRIQLGSAGLRRVLSGSVGFCRVLLCYFGLFVGKSFYLYTVRPLHLLPSRIGRGLVGRPWCRILLPTLRVLLLSSLALVVPSMASDNEQFLICYLRLNPIPNLI